MGECYGIMEILMPKVSYNQAVEHTNKILGLCQNILVSNGPFLKEGVYQDLLCHELSLSGIVNSREYVFPYRLNDSRGEQVIIGNGQSLRSDIELSFLGGILELKSTTHLIKDEYVWQLRNYLEQRPECCWGIVINFVSKFTSNTGPCVQAQLLYKTDRFMSITGSDNATIQIQKYKSYNVESSSYPVRDDIILSDSLDPTETP